ncbi:hypothetical protein LTR37_017505 [Vermiconidia calcicola]|uniref:Uncharacterized protein n=1 Tax=Vermiconidia calcicola TaxID=1690605 RepID=A0ACC3MJP7_9PEZI|nr:hypothetical protein LTR37_017505 [Vermiconidia calcicola]
MGREHSLKAPMGQGKSAADQSDLLKHCVAATGEFVGTFMFLFFAYLGHQMSVTQATSLGPNGTNSNSTVIYIAMSYGLSLLVTVWMMYRISGGLFRFYVVSADLMSRVQTGWMCSVVDIRKRRTAANPLFSPDPAVTLGLVVTGNMPPVRGLCLFPAQILGGIIAAALAACMIPGDIAIVQTTLAPRVSIAQGCFLEMFFTALLVFTVLMLAAEKSKDTFIAPIGIGLALFVAQIAGVHYTGASLNPARSFGPCVAGASFQGYHWIYWVGPYLGALIAAGYYHFVKFMNYEEVNPGQDSAGGDFEK